MSIGTGYYLIHSYMDRRLVQHLNLYFNDTSYALLHCLRQLIICSCTSIWLIVLLLICTEGFSVGPGHFFHTAGEFSVGKDHHIHKLVCSSTATVMHAHWVSALESSSYGYKVLHSE